MTTIDSLPSDELHQKGVLQEFLAGDSGPWTTVYRSGDLCLFAGFAPLSSVPALLGGYSWDIHISRGGPSLWRDSDGEAHYDCSFGDFDVQPVAIIQDHLGVLPRMLPQLFQEFCLYHNLWHTDGRVYKKLHDDGTEEVACEVSDDLVRIRTKLLRQFQAAAQLVLVRYIGSTVRNEESLGCDSTELNLDFGGGDHRLSLLVRENKRTGDKLSSLTGKRVVLPPLRSECGKWPFAGQEEAAYLEFDIGETPEGDPIKSTCDPDALDNYFGLNPGAPPYVTPVYFAPEVLDRYYSDPKFQVSDGYLSCEGLWGLSLDNNHPDHVMVWLGDLGCDLPERERLHWLAHNIFVPDGTPSQTALRRDILGEWAEADSPAWRLQRAYEDFRERWAAVWGWDLFSDPNEDELGLLACLRVPPKGTDAEFSEQVQALYWLLVESINMRQLKPELPKGEEGEKSISLLERWLQHKSHQHTVQDIGLLRKINDLRIVGEHRVGSKHAKVIAKHQIDDDRREAVSALFEEAIAFLGSLEQVQVGANV